ncbi:2'-5' RNA ligase family protein [Bacillus sp. 03113]|uniref:2'-5' RNA ligase family protein n=1 Tax=Bacillus sp. 03113 TaxID=2578211 RepID=UPI0011446779|nr:2'-5' RNA ligase family protein [Bacillus sp. 03113]
MKCNIVLYPGKELQDLVNSYRKRYDTQYAFISPHISLVHAFETEESKLPEISDKLFNVANKFSPLQIQVTKVSTFQPVNNVLYLKITPTDELLELYKNLNAMFGNDHHEDSYVPHITIGQELSNSEISDIYGSLSKRSFLYEEQINRFHLLYQLENGSWATYETFRLREGS